jgi:putative transposase
MDQLAGLSQDARKLAFDRFRLLQPHLEDDRPLKAVATAARVPFRTAQRWVSLYRQFGLAGLARKKRTDNGRRRAISAKLKEVIEGLALQKPPLPVASICRQVRRLAQDLGEEPPNYWVVYRIVAGLPADLVTLAHEGTKAYSNTFELVHRREADRPNAIWQADHTPLDILLIRPDGVAAKPWLTTVIDDYSRAVAGYLLSFADPSALHTSLALRQAIWRKEDPRWIVCGIPDVLYTDNGSDFRSQHLEQVGADLKIRLVFSIPGKPRGRGRIERFFSTVNEMFLCELEGYAPAGGAVRAKPTLTLAEFGTKFRDFLLGVYHNRKNSETKIPPVER